jgi:hypothetical protein
MGLDLPRFTRDHLFGEALDSVSVVGNVHPRRWRWNPFERELDLIRIDEHLWQRPLRVEGPQGVEHSGHYALRLVVNHNPRRQLKATSSSHTPELCCWHLAEDPLGQQFTNVAFHASQDGELLLQYDSAKQTLTLTPSSSPAGQPLWIEPVEQAESYELNGFIWDELDMFTKFEARRPGRSLQRDPDGAWSLEVPLRRNGGIDFRADGVYQFLIATNGEEDWGFAALNDGHGTLVRGTGFGSSHGTSLHSGCTIKANSDGLYRFRLLDPQISPRLEVQAPDGTPVPLLNRRDSIQLLGSVWSEAAFDPTVPGRSLVASAQDPNLLLLELEVQAGSHVINFAIGGELFLDTMGFGCWLEDADQAEGTVLRGLAWHGKPQEWNIVFALSQNSRLQFSYRLDTDEFGIAVVSGPGRLTPTTAVQSLSLVGSFEAPLVPWDPRHPANLMASLGGGRFQRCVPLQAGCTYSYKYVANQSDWQLVFADYELDGYGRDFAGRNPHPGEPSIASLRRFGQLTTHGNPPPLSFTAIHTGPHRFFADVISGAYAVHPL